MPKTKGLTLKSILPLVQQGLSYRQVAEKLGCDHKTVSYHLATPRARKLMSDLERSRKPRRGRPSKDDNPEHIVEALDGIDARKRWARYYGQKLREYEVRLIQDKLGRRKEPYYEKKIYEAMVMLAECFETIEYLREKIAEYEANGQPPEEYVRDRSRRRQRPREILEQRLKQDKRARAFAQARKQAKSSIF